MSRLDGLPRFVWRLSRFLPPRIAYSIGLGPLVGPYVLLLKTTGRKSGLPRLTPLLYDEINGKIYVATARGTQADWYTNLLVNPIVEVTIGSRRFRGHADPITDQADIVHFLEERMRLHPRLIAVVFRMAGLGASPTQAQLEDYASRRGLVAIRPLVDG